MIDLQKCLNAIQAHKISKFFYFDLKTTHFMRVLIYVACMRQNFF